jgi:hypothetical protein
VLVELIGWDLGQLEELLVSDDLVLIEHKQDEHLVGRTEELVTLPRFKGATNLCISQSKLPVE